MKKLDLVGKKFGRLTVLNYLKLGKCECVCSCGNTSLVFTSNLKRGHTQSCGCLAREKSSIRLCGDTELVSKRIRSGWPKEKAFNTPVIKKD